MVMMYRDKRKLDKEQKGITGEERVTERATFTKTWKGDDH